MGESSRYLVTATSFGLIIISFLIGWASSKKAKSNQSYFGGTGLFGPVAVSLSTLAAVASAFAIVGIPGIIYATGNTMTLWMFSAVAFAMAYLILGKKVRAMAEVGPVASLGDISDLRFNNHRGIKLLLSLVVLVGSIAYLASQITACAALFSNLLGWKPIVAAFVIFGILTVYTALSGEVGGILTQAFQGLIMIVAGVIMIIAFVSITGGMENVVEVVSNAKPVTSGAITKNFSPNMLNGWGVLPGSVAMAYMFIPILGTVGQPQVLTRMYALKNPKDMPKLGLYAGIAHMIVGFFAILMGYAALYLVANGSIAPLAKPDDAIFAVANHVGLYAQIFVYAAILSAALSTASMFLSLSANIISRDIPSALGMKLNENNQITVSRIVTFIIGVCSIIFAMSSGEAVAILGTFGWGTLMSATFPVFVIGLLWKRTSSQGVFAGLLIALILNVTALILNTRGFKWPGGLPWYVSVITIAIVITVVVSLFTKGATGDDLNEEVEAVIDL